MNTASITKASNEFTKKAIDLLNENLWTHNTEAKGKEGVKRYINLVTFLMLYELHSDDASHNPQKIKGISELAIKDFNDLKLIIRHHEQTSVKYKGDSLSQVIQKMLGLMGWTKELSEKNIQNQDLLFIHQYTPYNYYLEYAVQNVSL